MAYKFYNPNPTGKMVGDCVIRGVAFLTDQDWESAYMSVVMQGYADHDMPSSNAVWEHYLKRQGYKRRVLPDTCPDCYTVKQFCKDHNHGSFLLSTGSHVIAVRDGDYYDAWDSGNEIPVSFWAKGD
jgi:hypothetical protein